MLQAVSIESSITPNESQPAFHERKSESPLVGVPVSPHSLSRETNNRYQRGPIGTDFPTVETTWCVSRADRQHVGMAGVHIAGGTHLPTEPGTMQVIQTEGVLRVTFYVRIGR